MVLIPFGFSEFLIEHVDVITAVNMISQSNEGCTFVPWKKKQEIFLSKDELSYTGMYVYVHIYLHIYAHTHIKKHVLMHTFFSFLSVSPYKLPNLLKIVYDVLTSGGVVAHIHLNTPMFSNDIIVLLSSFFYYFKKLQR